MDYIVPVLYVGLEDVRMHDCEFIPLTNYYFDRIRRKLTHSSEVNSRRFWSDGSTAGVVSNITITKRGHLSGELVGCVLYHWVR